VITITGFGDHNQPEWLITFTGMRTQCSELTSQLYFDGGDYPTATSRMPCVTASLHSWFGGTIPRISLPRGLHKPYFEARYDFALVPCQARDIRRKA
jgi:hypothetical protein